MIKSLWLTYAEDGIWQGGIKNTRSHTVSGCSRHLHVRLPSSRIHTEGRTLSVLSHWIAMPGCTSHKVWLTCPRRGKSVETMWLMEQQTFPWMRSLYSSVEEGWSFSLSSPLGCYTGLKKKKKIFK